MELQASIILAIFSKQNFCQLTLSISPSKIKCCIEKKSAANASCNGLTSECSYDIVGKNIFNDDKI